MNVVAALRASDGGADDNQAQAGHVVAAALTTNCYADHESQESKLVVAQVAHTLRAEGHDASEDGTGRGAPLVVDIPSYQCLACGEVFQDPYATDARSLAPAECPKCGEERERLNPVPSSGSAQPPSLSRSISAGRVDYQKFTAA